MTVHEGMTTPWGTADFAEEICEGVGIVSTPGHGGIKLDASRNRLVPDYMRRRGGWYEEDCEWALVFVALATYIAERTPAAERRDMLDHAPATVRQWFPDAYEKFFGVTIAPGDSHVKDERQFYADHADDWITVSASLTNAPAGMVLVTASVGGRRGNRLPRERKTFVVPEEDYKARSSFGFIVDPERYDTVNP